MDILPNNRTVEIRSLGGQLLGYGYAVAGAAGGVEKNQVQRWFLLKRGADSYPPRTAVQFKFPADATWRSPSPIANVNDFIAKVQQQFDAASHLYAKCNCMNIVGPPNGQSTIPSISVPPPDFLSPPGTVPSQLDLGTCELFQGGVPVGYTFTKGALPDRHEHWALYPGYNPPGSDAPGGGHFVVRAGHIEEPNNFAALFNQKIWSAQHTYIVAACRYHAVFPTADP
jgi:hypothetical protein